MLFSAKRAKNTASKANSKINKAELKMLFRYIEKAAREGKNSFRWNGSIQVENITFLEKRGYVVFRALNGVYSIIWR